MLQNLEFLFLWIKKNVSKEKKYPEMQLVSIATTKRTFTYVYSNVGLYLLAYDSGCLKYFIFVVQSLGNIGPQMTLIFMEINKTKKLKN